MIFEDATNKRWKRASIVFGIIAIVGIFLITQLVISFFINSPLTNAKLFLQSRGVSIKANIIRNSDTTTSTGTSQSKPYKKRIYPYIPNNIQTSRSFSGGIAQLFPHQFVNSVFLIKSDQNGIDDLKQHISNINLVFTDGYNLGSGVSACDINDNMNEDFIGYLFDENKIMFPRFSNNDDSGNWLGQQFADIMNNPDNAACLIQSLVTKYQNHGFRGINLDIENLSSTDTIPFVNWVEDLTRAFHKENMYVTIDLPMNNDVYDYEALSNIVDGIVIMAYDEHYIYGEAGSIASNERFKDGVADILKRVNPQKTIIAVGNYAYDRNTAQTGSAANSMSFDDTVTLADDVGADIQTDTTTVNSTFSYLDSNKNIHQVRMLDGISARNEYYFTRTNKALGISLRRIGIEDPSLWKFRGTGNYETFDTKNLLETATLDKILFNGDGEILKVDALPQKGYRSITTDGKYIDSADYSKLPTSYDVEKYGHINKPFVALTFDDGPDPIYTPQVLNILKQNNISATFFIVGDQAQRYPNVLKEIIRDGNMVGNHTFLHPNIENISTRNLKLEVNINERLIESIINKKTYLFRAPYDTDSSPSTFNEVKPLYYVSKMGYIIVDADIDSRDYDKPGVDAIVKNILDGLQQTHSNIVVMHDAGGNREQTIAALKKVIPILKAQGYTIGTIADMLNVSPKVLMPNISLGEKFVILSDGLLVWIHTRGRNIIVILFLMTTIFSIFRILFLGGFILFSSKKQKVYLGNDSFVPPVSVLIPAYNEGKVIEKTLRTLQKSTYPDFEMVVIDDGSTDDTSAKTLEMAEKDPRIKLIRKENGGKFSALNLGFREVKNEYIVTIDADTMVTPDTIRHLVSPFENPEIDAVCGNVEVGNVKNILTGFQSLEYVTSQNYDRRAFDILNCISVVPGATGGWKKSKVLEVGGYSGDTLTEDADLTLTMLAHKAKIVYNPFAIGITEAPETMKGLYKQRFRWTYGTYQCLRKHRENFFKGPMGRIALPNIFIFQVIFPILSPIGDIVFILSIIRGDFRAIAVGYCLFLLMDAAGSLIAFILDNKPKGLILLVFIQRFFYRQFMYIIAFKAMKNVIKGRHHGRNKLERTNSILEKK